MSYLVLKTWSGFCGRECIITFPCKCYFHQIPKFPTSENCLPFPVEKWQIWVKLKSRCPINWGMGISENNPRNWLLFHNSCSKMLPNNLDLFGFWITFAVNNYETQSKKKWDIFFMVSNSWGISSEMMSLFDLN